MPVYQQQLPGLDDIQTVQQPAIEPGRSIQQRFEAFHALNPWVLRHLEALTENCVDKGFRRVGIGMLFELLRWRYGQATQGDAFRLNNNFRSRYVRFLIERHPEWAHLFETRALRAA
ncbi:MULTISPECIES: hypothetical protein [unclassified Streptomyces]|uniref:hypothetical protein n=1 Tax=unclassified Streptomyces TaxID=2593676 RepID=UPI002E80B1CF|nr:hypothetical protein [Streptomyces sp. NBC_00589]WTI37427.1 hypothetical protein OIC96_21625 [Streptomyces sp. NBC_00775]WUB28896.1 hypothetical protein OHA51_28110 [Streptomyces sp. NBC_00589]